MSGAPSIVCPKCKRRSHHPQDVEFRYCGACGGFHDDLTNGKSPAPFSPRLDPPPARPLAGRLPRRGG